MCPKREPRSAVEAQGTWRLGPKKRLKRRVECSGRGTESWGPGMVMLLSRDEEITDNCRTW